MKFIVRTDGGPVRRVSDDFEVALYLADPPPKQHQFRPETHARARAGIRSEWRFASTAEVKAAGFKMKPATKPKAKATKKAAAKKGK